MRNTHLPQARPRALPVILATARHRNLWPLSTPSYPYFLRAIGDRPSTMARLLSALESTGSYDPPLVLLSEGAAAQGLPEIQRLRPDAQIMLLPDGTGTGICMLLAALLVDRTSRAGPLAFVPAAFHCDDPVAVMNCLADAAATSQELRKAVMMATLERGSGGSHSLEVGPRLGSTNLFSVLGFAGPKGDGYGRALAETDSLMRSCGPAAVTPDLVMEAVSQAFPTLLSTCSNALNLAEKSGRAMRPRSSFLRLAGQARLTDLLAAGRSNLVACQLGPDCRVISTFADPLLADVPGKPAFPVGVAGYPGHRLIASQSGVLVLRPGEENAVKDICVGAPEADEASIRASTPAPKPPMHATRLDWGSQSLLHEGDGSMVLCRLVKAGKSIPAETWMASPRSIAVISGSMLLKTASGSQTIGKGDHVVIPRRVTAQMFNSGTEPLSLIETRTGCGDVETTALQFSG